MFTYPKYAIGDGFTTLALLFLGDEDFVDQHAQKACEVAVCDDAGKNIGQVGHG